MDGHTRTRPVQEPAIKVLLVDDQAIWRRGVRSVLEGTEFQVVGEACSGPEAIQVARETCPHIILLDIRMEGADGLGAPGLLTAEHPRAVILVLTGGDNAGYRARAAAIGAAGYLVKEISVLELLNALRAAATGQAVTLPNGLEGPVRAGDARFEQAEDTAEPLTRREQEVLGLLARGMSNREIAGALSISSGTVKTHVERILRKLGVADRLQAALWAAAAIRDPRRTSP